jgi:hypothetical protein
VCCGAPDAGTGYGRGTSRLSELAATPHTTEYDRVRIETSDPDFEGESSHIEFKAPHYWLFFGVRGTFVASG